MITSFTGEHKFLSNFFLCPFDFQGICWPSAEHAYQAAKAAPDLEMITWIHAAPTPAEAKRRGRQVPLPPQWDGGKKLIMLDIVSAKFGGTPDLRRRLAATGGDLLVEGNTWGDTYWGAVALESSAIAPDCPVWAPEPPGTMWLAGENWLGKILMMVREVSR